MKILNFKMLLSVALLVVGLSSSQAVADFSQPYDPTSGDFQVSDIVGGTTQRVADSFRLDQPFDPATNNLYITWWGGFNVNNAAAHLKTIDFRINLHPTNSNDLPTIPSIGSFETYVTVTGVDVIDPAGAWDAYRYTALIEGNNLLTSGNQYWLSIVDVDPDSAPEVNGSVWHWAAAASAGSYAIRNSDSTAWQGSGLTNRAFSIDVVNFPEPGCWLLCGVGLPWIVRRKKFA